MKKPAGCNNYLTAGKISDFHCFPKRKNPRNVYMPYAQRFRAVTAFSPRYRRKSPPTSIIIPSNTAIHTGMAIPAKECIIAIMPPVMV